MSTIPLHITNQVAAVTDREWKMLRWAQAGAQIFSTCAKRQYLSIVLSPDGRVVGSGYNGSPPGIPHCTDGHCPRLQQNSASGTSYGNCIAVHAEANALMYSNRDERAGGTLIINGQPCWDCGKLIAGSGLGRVVIVDDPAYSDGPRVNQLLRDVGISVAIADRDLLEPGQCSKCSSLELLLAAVEDDIGSDYLDTLKEELNA